MKYCGNCGTANNDEMNFCEGCGAKLSATGGGSAVSSVRGGTETKIIQVDNSPSVINATSELWGIFGWTVMNVQVTHSQDTKTYTKGVSDYYLGTKTVETTTINYATITFQRNKGIVNYQRIVELEKEYQDLQASLDLLSNKYSPYTLNIPLLVLAFMFFCPAAVYMIVKHIKDKKSEEEMRDIIRQQNGNESQIHSRMQQILNEASKYTA